MLDEDWNRKLKRHVGGGQYNGRDAKQIKIYFKMKKKNRLHAKSWDTEEEKIDLGSEPTKIFGHDKTST